MLDEIRDEDKRKKQRLLANSVLKRIQPDIFIGHLTASPMLSGVIRFFAKARRRLRSYGAERFESTR